MLPYEWLLEAEKRIAPHIRRTPLAYDEQRRLYLKWENHQISGSFKLRGALNKVLSLGSWEVERGLVTASAGNHGKGVALAGKLVQAQVTIFVSEHALPVKIQAMQAAGADVRQVRGGYAEAEKAGLAFAQETGSTWISPYNDGQVIAGQGTLAIEIWKELAQPSEPVWVVPVGGGGLISGIGSALSALEAESLSGRKPQLIGVQSAASPYFHAIFHTGNQQGIREFPSLADGLSGAVEAGSITIPLVRRTVDDIQLVTEDEIAAAMAFAWHHYGEMIEGSAATTLAAILANKIPRRPALLVITGGNVQPEVHHEILTRFPNLESPE